MKKLLSILSSMVIVGAGTSGVISCSKTKEEDQRKNSNGDSIWAWIPGIYGGKQVTSPDIWNVLTEPFTNTGSGQWTNDPLQWDGATRVKMSVQLMQILSVAILANPDKFFQSGTTIADIADYQNLKDILKNQWNLLVQSTNNTVQNKIQSFKDSDKKNWEKKYHDFLDNTYPDITGAKGSKKYEIEEQNYKAAIMTTGADSGTSATNLLTNILLNNNMRAYQTNSTNTALDKLTNFNTFVKDGNKPADWSSNDQNSRTLLALSFSWNTTTNDFGANLSALTPSEINTRLEKIETDLKTANYDISTYLSSHTPVSTPVFINSSSSSIGTPLLTQSYDSGQYSLFQKYLIENWYQNEKPLAISKVTYAYKSGATPTDTGFTEDAFDESVKNQINNDLTALKSATNWDDFTNNMQGTSTPATSLLTLSTSDDAVKSNILKSSVYNSLGATASSAATDLSATVTALNRSKNNDPISANWQIGSSNDMVVAYFDTDGLNLIHVDGREYLTDATATSYNYNSDWQFNSLNYSQIYYQPLTDKSSILTTNTANQKLNTQFGNAQYLWYLTNRSLVNAQSNSKLKFKVLDEVKKYATLSSSSTGTDNTWWFWIYDFFNNFNNKILTNGNANWLSNFITFNNQTGGTTTPEWFTNIINAMSTNLSGGAVQRLLGSFETENKTIQGYKAGGPTAEIDTNSIIAKINSSKIWDEQITTRSSNQPSKIFSWNLQINNISTTKEKYYNIGDYDWYRNYYKGGIN